MDKENKRKYILPICAAVIVGIITILMTTYSYWQVTRKQTNRNLVSTACLSVTYSNETGDIQLEKQWPTPDYVGQEFEPYTFTITNTCDEEVSYIVALEEIKDTDSDPISYPNDYLSDNHVKVKIDGKYPSILGSLDNLPDDTNQSYQIYGTKKLSTRTLQGGESRTHYLRLWLDSDTPIQNNDESSNMSKFFFSKIKVLAGQGIDLEEHPLSPESCFTFDTSTGTITDYDYENQDCGTDSLVVPPTINNVQVKKINFGSTDCSQDHPSCVDYGYLDLSKAIYLEEINNDSFKKYTGNDNDLVLPDSVKSIGGSAFTSYKGPKVVLSNNLKEVYSWAFYNYEGYGEELHFPKTMEYIDIGTFQNFRGNRITFEEDLSRHDNVNIDHLYIGTQAFEQYNGENVTIPSYIDRIDNNAFYSMGPDKKFVINTNDFSYASTIDPYSWNSGAEVVCMENNEEVECNF